jgi:rhamnosyl/mannosyltransferase
VEGQVTWAGYLPPEALAGAYRAATALWFPSNARSEAYGLSQIEAMASGVPVLNTAIPHSGVPWVSLHGQTGLTVPVGDAEALARAARRLVEEPGLAEHLGQEARVRALEQFRHDVMAERSLSLYAEALRVPWDERSRGTPVEGRS